MTRLFARALVLALLVLPSLAAGAEPRLVLLDFHSESCGPCRQMRPAIARLADKGYPVKSVDIDKSPDLARRYNVTEVPTFIVIDDRGRALGRSSGLQPAGELATLFHEAFAKANPVEARTAAEDDPPREVSDSPPEAADTPTRGSKPPAPWATTVRIKIRGPRAANFGSGTIIHSTESESIILTCAHIFDMDGRRVAAPQFNRPILIDLFDGQLHGTNPAMVHPLETDIPGKAIDYNFDSDLGLIRIRPGRKLPSSPVVGTDWQPRRGLKMDTVGCSEGHDATAWTTRITNPLLQGSINGSKSYEAIECEFAPKQGRSGGGLFTRDGYLAGVCDFAAPMHGNGLYASPRAIHRFLDRNRLSFCYNGQSPPAGFGTLLASATPDRPAPAAQPRTTFRGQDSPITRDPIPMPEPDQIGVRIPPVARAAPVSNRPGRRDDGDDLIPAELAMNPGLVPDRSLSAPRSESVAPIQRIEGAPVGTSPTPWRTARAASTAK